MVSKLPVGRDELLTSGLIDPEFEAALKKDPIPGGKDYSIETLKMFAAYGLPRVQKEMAASRPSDVLETEVYMALPTDGFKSRTIVCSPSGKSAAGPVVVLFYGGGHCIGAPEHQLLLARRLVQAHEATVVLPSYRLAPEFRAPQSFIDSWECLKIIANESILDKSSIFSRPVSPHKGFIVGGESAGSAIAASLAHLARDQKLNPPLTGQYLVTGAFMSPNHVPDKYKDRYLSREQNKNAPLLDEDLWNIFNDAAQLDDTSPLCMPFDQHDPRDAPGEVKLGHMGLPPTYFQICGLDMSRDDDIIYESVLREECGIATKVDFYPGYPHCWWVMPPFAKLSMTKQREDDTIAGFGWLLENSHNS